MLIENVDYSAQNGLTVFGAELKRLGSKPGPERLQIVFHREVESPIALGDPFLAALLVPCMFLREPLEIKAPVSARLLAGTDIIQQILRNWYPQRLSQIPVRAEHVCTPPARHEDQRYACFFSGGVDSWYSALKHKVKSPTLITVKGFDIPYTDNSIWPGLIEANRHIAQQLGLELIAVETNLRDCLDPTCTDLGKSFNDDFWGKYFHGAFLASVGLCLQRHFSRIIIPSSYSYIQLHPWGTHPLLDPLWSTELCEFYHDGCDASRMDKLQVVAQSLIALNHLRVCFCYTPGRYNCCVCEKCRRTMLGLHLLGVLDRATSFDLPLNLDALVSMRLMPSSEVWYEDILALAEAKGNQPMANLLRVILGRKFNARRTLSWAKRRVVLVLRKVAGSR